jgi:hypothetical protein
MKRLMPSLFGILLLVVLVGIPALAICTCLDDCPYDLDNCSKTGDGGCWQNRYNRCDDGVCGLYDPLAGDCQFGYTWDEYYCDAAWPFPDYYCEAQTDYWEACFPE